MSGVEIAFTVIAVISGLAAIAVVATRNVVHGALWLVVVLGMLAALFILLGAEFVGWVQILIYVGAIIVLLLFGLMLTKAPIGRLALDNQQRGIAFVSAAGTFAVLTWLIWRAFGDQRIDLSKPTRTAEVGRALFQDFILPFEAISFLLLAALVGAIVLAKKD